MGNYISIENYCSTGCANDCKEAQEAFNGQFELQINVRPRPDEPDPQLVKLRQELQYYRESVVASPPNNNPAI